MLLRAGPVILGRMFRAAVFDFGGVVTTPIADAFAGVDRAAGVEPGTVLRLMREARDRADDAFHRLETGALSEHDFYAGLRLKIEQIAGRTVAWPADALGVRRLLLGSLRRNDQMLAAIERIARHYPVGMLTNNVREWSAWRDHYPMELFRVVVDSSDVGMRKPDPAIYRLTCERMGVDPSVTVFVDDLEENVEGANAVGMRGVVFTTTQETIGALRELLPLAFGESG